MREESREKSFVLSGEVELLVQPQSWGGRGCQAASKNFSPQGSLARGSPAGDWVPAEYLECCTRQMVKNHINVYDDARQIVQDMVISLGQRR
jgi:hypothetical protein